MGLARTLPLDVDQNVAGKAAASLLQALGNPFGIEITVRKTIMPGSGIGSSAASAVAAVVGVDALAEAGMRHDELLPFAFDGEAVASGARHADNVAPALMGGMTLIDPDGNVCALPVPSSWHLVVLHPQVVIKTAESRAVLPAEVPLAACRAIRRRGWGVLCTNCMQGQELEAMYALEDLLVGPQRGQLMPHWEACRTAAREAGARAGGISGSGPSSFWVCRSEKEAQEVSNALGQVMAAQGMEHHLHLTSISSQGAHVVPQSD